MVHASKLFSVVCAWCVWTRGISWPGAGIRGSDLWNKTTFSFFSTPGNIFIVALKQKLITINKMVLHFKISFISHFMLNTREKMASSGKTHLNLRLDGCWKRKTMQLLKFCFVPFIFFVKCEYIGWWWSWHK